MVTLLNKEHSVLILLQKSSKSNQKLVKKKKIKSTEKYKIRIFNVKFCQVEIDMHLKIQINDFNQIIIYTIPKGKLVWNLCKKSIQMNHTNEPDIHIAWHTQFLVKFELFKKIWA